MSKTSVHPHPPVKRRKGITLRTAGDARRLLAKITNQFLVDEIEEKKYRALAYGLTVYLRAAEQSVLENELEDLKKQLEERKWD